MNNCAVTIFGLEYFRLVKEVQNVRKLDAVESFFLSMNIDFQSILKKKKKVHLGPDFSISEERLAFDAKRISFQQLQYRQ